MYNNISTGLLKKRANRIATNRLMVLYREETGNISAVNGVPI